MKNFTLFLLVILYYSATAQKNPTFEEVLSLSSISNVNISPNGNNILFEVSKADWENNRYDREIWMSRNESTPFQLTNNPTDDSRDAQWSPDGQWIAFRSKRGEKHQIYIMKVDGGESFPLTNTNNNISSFRWSPDGQRIAFIESEDNSEEEKSRKEKFGAFEVEDQEYKINQLWVVDFKPQDLYSNPLPQQLNDSTLNENKKAKLLLENPDYSVNNFDWSPDGQKIAFSHQPDPMINSFFKSDISIYDLSTKQEKILVNNLSADRFLAWSPDSRSVLYTTSLNDSTSNYYLNNKLFRIDVNGENNKQLAKDFDENINNINWNEGGIFGTAWQRTQRPLVKIGPDNGEVSVLNIDLERIWSYSFSNQQKRIAYIGVGDDNLSELYLGDFPLNGIKKITNSTEQIMDFNVAQSEVVQWKSKDGAMIEGVLYKPKNYDPQKKYPLLVVIHGGPTGISLPNPTASYVYPITQWLNKGALVLSPNYRGSAGYGEKFRSLNVKNLGVGDAWDVLSGVDHLEKKGIIDGDKVGAMGWSQGGYISAFLATNSDKFKAISVGAGISNWMTYYVNTDIHPFTRQYLKATPWSDKAIYEKTSPMTNIKNATTPTLIQHGEFDKRVPTANAYELFQGLQDVGVDTKLIIYKGFGHGITKPKERLAAMWHNWQWFGKYIWDEDIELPLD